MCCTLTRPLLKILMFLCLLHQNKPLAELPVNFNALIFAAAMQEGAPAPHNHDYLSLTLWQVTGVIFSAYLSDFFKEGRTVGFYVGY